MRNLVPPPLSIVLEQWHAWRSSRQMLTIYWIVREERPELRDAASYEQIVARRGHLGDRAPDAIVQHAAESIAKWPVERPLRFRDIVHYVAVDDYLRSHSANRGTRSDMRKMVEHVIPEVLWGLLSCLRPCSCPRLNFCLRYATLQSLCRDIALRLAPAG